MKNSMHRMCTNILFGMGIALVFMLLYSLMTIQSNAQTPPSYEGWICESVQVGVRLEDGSAVNDCMWSRVPEEVKDITVPQTCTEQSEGELLLETRMRDCPGPCDYELVASLVDDADAAAPEAVCLNFSVSVYCTVKGDGVTQDFLQSGGGMLMQGSTMADSNALHGNFNFDCDDGSVVASCTADNNRVMNPSSQVLCIGESNTVTPDPPSTTPMDCMEGYHRHGDLTCHPDNQAHTVPVNPPVEDDDMPKDGKDGMDGYNCWDTNQDHEHQDDEDTNEDGKWNTLDCQGPRGERGPIGPSGHHCWDLNENNLADKAEDINEDGVVNVLDCHGEDGEDAEGTGFWELDYTPGCSLARAGTPPKNLSNKDLVSENTEPSNRPCPSARLVRDECPEPVTSIRDDNWFWFFLAWPWLVVMFFIFGGWLGGVILERGRGK